MVGVLHVDEIDDDDPAEVAQAKLAGDDLRSLEVGLEDCVVEAASADEAAGVDVDRRHGLGLIDDEIAARLEIHPAPEGLLDLVFYAVQIEQRPFAAVMSDAVEYGLRVLLRKVQHPLAGLVRVDQDAHGLLGSHVAKHALREAQILIDQRWHRQRTRLGGEIAPELGQIFDVVLQLALGRGLCHGADDEASRQPLGKELLQSVAQVFALGLVLDALRDADMRILRQIDEQPPGETDLCGEPRALGADRVLDHLHQ